MTGRHFVEQHFLTLQQLICATGYFEEKKFGNIFHFSNSQSLQCLFHRSTDFNLTKVCLYKAKANTKGTSLLIS